MRPYLRMLGFVRPYWRLVLLNALCITMYALLSSVSVLSVSPFVRILFDAGPAAALAEAPDFVPAEGRRLLGQARIAIETFLLPTDRVQALGRFCILLLLLFLAKNLFQYGQTYLTSLLEQRALRDIRARVFGHICDMPLATFARERTGMFISRLTNDVTLMRSILVGHPASIVRNTLMILLGLGILVLASWKLALVAAAVLPPNAWLISRIGRRLKRRSSRAQHSMSEMANVVQEAAAGARVVKAFGMQAFEQRRFGKYNVDYFRDYLRLSRLRATAQPISEMLAIAAVTAILWFGGRFVLDGELPVDRLFLFLTAMVALAEPIKALIGVNNSLQEGLAAGERVLALLDLPREPARLLGRAATFERELRFEQVSFGYEPGRAVLRDVDLGVRPGEIVALVGPSGSGKSTLVDLIPRFYEVSSGRVTLDGVDVRELSLESLRGLLGIVTQEVILFNDSVRANIAYGQPDVPPERIEAAARAANAHEFIRKLPAGYDSLIGERGVMLSGGERQRLSIARAILRDPRILILDEATSSLDSESELLIQEALDRLMRGRTAFVVAHRLSTIQRADTILVIADGAIVERGTHADLLSRQGAYARLHELQFR